MAGSSALRFLQLGAETQAGTAVPATALWRGLGAIEDARQVTFVAEDIGYVSGVDRTYVPKLLAKLAMDAVPATFEQLPYLLSAGVVNVVTGAADGTGSDKIYAYPLPTTSIPNIKSYTLEAGDDQQCEEMEYSFVEAFKLSGKAGEAWMMGGDWVGRQVSPSSKTASIAVPTVEEMLFGNTKLYIDDVGGVLGTTQKSNTLLGADLSVKTGRFACFTDSLHFSLVTFNKDSLEALLAITFIHDGTSVAEKAAWRAQTPRQIRIQCEGSAVATPGTTYSKKTLNIDLAGKWEKFDKLGAQDGNDIVTGTFRAKFNETANLFAKLTVVNELVALP